MHNQMGSIPEIQFQNIFLDYFLATIFVFHPFPHCFCFHIILYVRSHVISVFNIIYDFSTFAV
jgi:hypothetical protein